MAGSLLGEGLFLLVLLGTGDLAGTHAGDVREEKDPQYTWAKALGHVFRLGSGAWQLPSGLTSTLPTFPTRTSTAVVAKSKHDVFFLKKNRPTNHNLQRV